MNRTDRYYLKQGRLELSMLEEEDTDQRTQQEVKITKEICYTLHTMGKLLVQEQQENLNLKSQDDEWLESLRISELDLITNVNEKIELSHLKKKSKEVKGNFVDELKRHMRQQIKTVKEI